MNLNLIIQGAIAAILIGMLYNVWISTRTYGGLIGSAVRLLGLGLLLITTSVIEKILLNFSIINPSTELNLAQDVLTLVGLFFLARGFSRLAKASK